MKTVYQTDAAGYYVGPTTADESPLEKGVYLMPAGCVEAVPPPLGEGRRARWAGDRWMVEASPEPPHQHREIRSGASRAIDVQAQTADARSSKLALSQRLLSMPLIRRIRGT